MLIPLGAGLGVIVANFVMDKFFRKYHPPCRTYLLILNIINLVVTGILQVDSLVVLFIFRLFQGVLVGNYMTLTPAYIKELGPKSITDPFGIFPQLSVVTGVLVAYVLGVIYDDTGLDIWIYWRFQMGFPFLIIITQTIFLLVNYLPESPQSLLLANDHGKAKEIFCLFVKESVVEEVVKEKLADVNTLKALKLTRPPNKALWMSLELSVFQACCGIVSMVTQAGHVISRFNVIVGRYTPVLITLAQFAGTLVSIYTLKKFEWRLITLLGGLALSACMFTAAMLFYFYTPQTNFEIMIGAMVCFTVFMFVFGVTYGSSIWPYIGRLLPRKSNIQAALVVNWLFLALTNISLSFTDFYIAPPYPMFFAYAAMTLLGVAINFFVMFPIKALSPAQLKDKLMS